MSKKTAKALITDALEDLSSRDLKKFRERLCDNDEPRVTRRSVEDADEMDLADLLVKICTEAKAVQLTISLFSQLGFSNQAEKLRKEAAIAPGPASAESRTKYLLEGGQHFVDKHRIRLIESITTVEPILDRLLARNIINHEHYTLIRAKSTSTQRMRELFDVGSIRSTAKGKDCLYDVLAELEPFVMEDLKERS